jgi:hypothetical protein
VGHTQSAVLWVQGIKKKLPAEMYVMFSLYSDLTVNGAALHLAGSLFLLRLSLTQNSQDAFLCLGLKQFLQIF